MAGATSYSIVVVTRNRPEALELSLPLLLAESRPPEMLLVVDSSEASTPVRVLLDRLAKTTQTPLRYIHSDPSMTRQRNIGLAEVTSDVVVFPDDDSLIHVGAIGAIMDIYDRDSDHQIGGVCTAEAIAPPPGSLSSTSEAYKKSMTDRIKARLACARFWIENRMISDPFLEASDIKQSRLGPPPDWLEEAGAKLVPFMTGFRMSYRTAAIARSGFDSNLGRYALFEDVDACLKILDQKWLVAALNTEGIYHHRAPSARADGRAFGAMQILNRAYIVAGSGVVTPKVARQTRRYGLYKICLYLLGIGNAYGRDRLAGAWASSRFVGPILASRGKARRDLYLEAKREVFGGKD